MTDLDLPFVLSLICNFLPSACNGVVRESYILSSFLGRACLISQKHRYAETETVKISLSVSPTTPPEQFRFSLLTISFLTLCSLNIPNTISYEIWNRSQTHSSHLTTSLEHPVYTVGEENLFLYLLNICRWGLQIKLINDRLTREKACKFYWFNIFIFLYFYVLGLPRKEVRTERSN